MHLRKWRLSRPGATSAALALLAGASLAAAPAGTARADFAASGSTSQVALDGESGQDSLDPKFTFAVLPDTQQEVLRADDTRFMNRTQWLADNRQRLDLRFVLHTGDVTNWGWLAPSQYDVASTAMGPLERARIPYALSAGNHDTRAVGWDGAGGYGGDAYVKNPECLQRFPATECDTHKLVRHTEEWNAVFPPSRFSDVGGTFEAGKSENMYTTYQAGRKNWLVLTLELWPRPEVVEWAQKVVESHPHHNVIIQTHSYLNADASINQTNGGYGSTSGQYLFDNLIKRYPNIKMVFSGHVGNAGQRTDIGDQGNVIYSFLQCFHSNTTNPVRLVEVDTVHDTLRTWIVGPFTGEKFNEYTVSLTDVDWN